MNFNQVSFLTSAPDLGGCPADSRAEVAFAGRSNVGKSSAINAITGHSRLARTSRTPGQTRMMNFFRVEAGLYLVDLPGYGYARAPLPVKRQWQSQLERYLRRREALTGLLLLSDIRHPLKEFDRMMIDWAVRGSLPLHLLLSKADKLKRGPAANVLRAVQRELVDLERVSVQLFSSRQGHGVEQARERLREWLQPSMEPKEADQA